MALSNQRKSLEFLKKKRQLSWHLCQTVYTAAASEAASANFRGLPLLFFGALATAALFLALPPSFAFAAFLAGAFAFTATFFFATFLARFTAAAFTFLAAGFLTFFATTAFAVFATLGLRALVVFVFLAAFAIFKYPYQLKSVANLTYTNKKSNNKLLKANLQTKN